MWCQGSFALLRCFFNVFSSGFWDFVSILLLKPHNIMEKGKPGRTWLSQWVTPSGWCTKSKCSIFVFVFGLCLWKMDWHSFAKKWTKCADKVAWRRQGSLWLGLGRGKATWRRSRRSWRLMLFIHLLIINLDPPFNIKGHHGEKSNPIWIHELSFRH